MLQQHLLLFCINILIMPPTLEHAVDVKRWTDELQVFTICTSHPAVSGFKHGSGDRVSCVL
jgi:hypothetical protein